MNASAPTSYSRLQIILHWTVAVLVLLQFLFSDGMEEAWDAFEDGITPEAAAMPAAYAHAAFGTVILLLALWRLVLRRSHGTPPAPEANPAAVKLAATITHVLLYSLLIALPLLGASAWVLGIEPAADLHSALTKVLFFVVILHIGGALVEHFFLRTNVLKRMLRLG